MGILGFFNRLFVKKKQPAVQIKKDQSVSHTNFLNQNTEPLQYAFQKYRDQQKIELRQQRQAKLRRKRKKVNKQACKQRTGTLKAKLHSYPYNAN